MVGLNHQQCKTMFTERFPLSPSSEFAEIENGRLTKRNCYKAAVSRPQFEFEISNFVLLNDHFQFLWSFNVNLNSDFRNIFMIILYFLDLPVEMLKF